MLKYVKENSKKARLDQAKRLHRAFLKKQREIPILKSRRTYMKSSGEEKKGGTEYHNPNFEPDEFGTYDFWSAA